MQIKLSGESYALPSIDINNQQSINLYPVVAGPEARAKIAQMPTPGLKELVTPANPAGTEVRGLIVYDDDLYCVVGVSFYKVAVNVDARTATATFKGTLNSGGSGPVSMARNPTQIMIVDGSTGGYIYTPTTDAFTAITDTDFTGGDMVVFMDSYFIYNTAGSSTIYATAINDGTDVDALDVVTAEGQPDRVVGLAVDKRELWVFGETSVEIWWNAANATGFPFSRRDGAFLDQGCLAKGSIQKFDNALIWLDNRGFVVRSDGYGIKIISTEAINAVISEYKTVTDAISYVYNDKGHLFYVLSFPTEDVTWVYDGSYGMWHQRAEFTNEDKFGRHIAQIGVTYKQLRIVGGHSSGKLYVMSDDYRDDDGAPIHRIKTSPHYNLEFNQITINELEIHLETGKGTVTGTGADPQIQLRYSNDGGYTWSHSMPRSMGKLGEYNKLVRWNRLGSGREWLFEFRIAEPVDFSIVDATIYFDGEQNG